MGIKVLVPINLYKSRLKSNFEISTYLILFLMNVPSVTFTSGHASCQALPLIFILFLYCSSCRDNHCPRHCLLSYSNGLDFRESYQLCH